MKYGEVLTWEQILLELSWSVLILKRKIILDNGVFIKGIDWENNSVFEIMCVHLESRMSEDFVDVDIPIKKLS